MIRLHVRNVPSGVTEVELQAVCLELGLRGEVLLVRDGGSGCYLGEAFLAIADEGEAERAVERLQDYDLEGTKLEVEIVEGSSFFDKDGLFADGAASMSRKDGEGA